MAEEPSRPAGVRRTQKERRETTRASLLAAAVRCICRDGYGATTLSNVAQEAGLSKGAVQHHFKDKRALMSAVIDAGSEGLTARLLATAPSEGSIEDRMNAVLDHWIEAYSNPVWMAALEVNDGAKADPVLRERNRTIYRECRAIIDRNWLRVFADAPVPPERVRAAGRLAFSMLAGILADQDSGPAADDVRDDLATLKEATYHMLTTPSGDGPFSTRKGARS